MNYADVKTMMAERVKKELPQHIGVVREALAADEDTMVARLALDIGGTLVQSGLLSSEYREVTNQLHLAVYKSKDLNEYVSGVLGPKLEQDPKTIRTLARLVSTPESVTDEDFQSAMKVVLFEEDYLFGYIRTAFRDAGVRSALKLSADFDIEGAVQSVKDRMASASSWSELVTSKTDNDVLQDSIAVPDTSAVVVVVAAAVAVLVGYAVVLVVQTVAVLQAYAAAWVIWAALVFTVTKVSAIGVDQRLGDAPDRALQPGSLKSGVINRTPHTLWCVVQTPGGLRRMALQPGQSSYTLGLTDIHSVLVDIKKSNHEPEQKGAFIFSDSGRSALVTASLMPSGMISWTMEKSVAEDEGMVHHRLPIGQFMSNEQQVESGQRRPLTTKSIAVAIPENFDMAHMYIISEQRGRFYRALRTASMINSFMGAAKSA